MYARASTAESYNTWDGFFKKQESCQQQVQMHQTMDSKEAVDKHIEVSPEATKLDSKCVPPKTTSHHENCSMRR